MAQKIDLSLPQYKPNAVKTLHRVTFKGPTAWATDPQSCMAHPTLDKHLATLPPLLQRFVTVLHKFKKNLARSAVSFYSYAVLNSMLCTPKDLQWPFERRYPCRKAIPYIAEDNSWKQIRDRAPLWGTQHLFSLLFSKVSHIMRVRSALSSKEH